MVRSQEVSTLKIMNCLEKNNLALWLNSPETFLE